MSGIYYVRNGDYGARGIEYLFLVKNIDPCPMDFLQMVANAICNLPYNPKIFVGNDGNVGDDCAHRTAIILRLDENDRLLARIQYFPDDGNVYGWWYESNVTPIASTEEIEIDLFRDLSK